MTLAASDFPILGQREWLRPITVVEVSGTKAGQPATARFTCIDHMDRLTGIPAAIAAIMIAEGSVSQVGALPPEAALEPAIFLAELEREGIAVTQELTTAAPVRTRRPAGIPAVPAPATS